VDSAVVKEPVTVFELLCFLVLFQAVVFTVTGCTHVVRPGRLRLIGAVEIVLAGALIGALFRGDGATLAAVEAIVAVYAVALVAYVARLYVRASGASCGCHPWAGRVNAASFLPAGAVFAAAAIGFVVALGAAFDVALTARDTWTVALAVLAGCTVLVAAGALATPLEPEGA
jgi:hypothetical protein